MGISTARSHITEPTERLRSVSLSSSPPTAISISISLEVGRGVDVEAAAAADDDDDQAGAARPGGCAQPKVSIIQTTTKGGQVAFRHVIAVEVSVGFHGCQLHIEPHSIELR